MKLFTSLWLILSFFFGALRFGFQPTVILDLADTAAPVGHYAAGNLYGLAENGVPSGAMTRSLGLTVLAQKAPEGLQHPIGDLSHVAPMAERARYLVVYLQDCFSTWYYCHDEIRELREAGNYDPFAFLSERFYPLLDETVDRLASEPYADRVVLCPYNECDNGIWFGEWVQGENGPWAAFNDTGRDTFFRAWEETYRRIRERNPEALIGGPGYYEYSAEKERAFLTFCAAHGCVPDVMIWHELSEYSARNWVSHVEEYRALEAELGLPPLTVAVTEYGTMAECGNPAAMLPYLAAMEESETYGCIAYWRLANNLNDNAADDNMPNACWWLYRWYAALSGSRVNVAVNDLFHSDFAKAVKEGRALRVKSFTGLAAADPAAREAAMLYTCDHAMTLRLKNVNAAVPGARVRVRVEAVQYRGLSGEVPAPMLLMDKTVCVCGNEARVRLPAGEPDAVYRVRITPDDGEKDAVLTPPARFEFETGALLGNAYTYRSAYASTGETAGIVGGMEQPGDGVRLTITAPKAGDYDLDLIYGKANDGLSPADRVSAEALLTLNGQTQTLRLPNTIKSEYTDCLRLTLPLKKGENTLVLAHKTGTFVLDSVLVSPHREADAIAVLPAANGLPALAVAPADGCYRLVSSVPALTVDGVPVTGSLVYLRRGLNELGFEGETLPAFRPAPEETLTLRRITPGDLALSGGAAVENGALTGITSVGGAAEARIFVPATGVYRLTFCYSNNQEGGAHDYNVDLVEAYFTVSANGDSRILMCRNTCSDENLSTVTLDLPLQAGENILRLSNDGSVRFAGGETVSPRLLWITVNETCR